MLGRFLSILLLVSALAGAGHVVAQQSTSEPGVAAGQGADTETVARAAAAAAVEAVSDYDLQLLQLYVTAGAAFLGFLSGTVIKFLIDLWLDRRAHGRLRTTLARELLAELRFIAHELERLRGLVARYKKEIEAGEISGDNFDFDRALVLPSTPFFDASIGKIGTLGAETASSVVLVFLTIRNINDTRLAYTSRNLYSTNDILNHLTKMFDPSYRELGHLITQLDQNLAQIAGVPAKAPLSVGEKGKPPKPVGQPERAVNPHLQPKPQTATPPASGGN
jgi:hypothetical protein